MRKYYYRYAYGVRLMKMLMHAFRSLIERRLHDVLGTAGSCFLCVEGIVPVHPATFELKAGFHPMEGENNMEWHGPNGPTYDNMMYDGNNQWSVFESQKYSTGSLVMYWNWSEFRSSNFSSSATRDEFCILGYIDADFRNQRFIRK